ncbi:hypothetical protein IAE33_000834 [Pseudomonas sp. S60]|uniref:hypothetical protein n=1 Tax=Pseudomonas sp. S60 TaxID=211124 RepID=UPI001912A8C0|nr:hypothetical protein [Pseudomonas sp. S60]MBK5008974.1 hypothetical protein [Pseudomonas sp. S60]
MKTIIAVAFGILLATGFALAKDHQHECEAALDKLKAATETDFTQNGHHEHQQAKEAHASGDYKKCADQANKALSHQKSG